MTIALKELVRARGRFVAVGAALTLIAVLVLLLGGLLDGLVRGSTGLLRAQEGELVVYADDARRNIGRSVLTPEVIDAIATVAGVDEVVPFGAAVVTAAPEGADDPDDLVGVAVVGYATAIGPVAAPGDGDEVTVESRITEAGIELGDELVLPGDITVTVGDTVDDVAYAGQATVWLPLDTWREVVTAARPGSAIGAENVNVASVTVSDDADPIRVADAIDDATGSTDTLTVAMAIDAIPGVAEQTATFSAIIGATLVVAGLVVALFFALLTLERAGLYAVLKALGSTTSQLAVGVAIQAVLVALGAAIVAGFLTVGLAALVPDGVPVELLWPRALVAVAGLLVTAVLGSAASLRRITRIDPAEAIS